MLTARETYDAVVSKSLRFLMLVFKHLETSKADLEVVAAAFDLQSAISEGVAYASGSLLKDMMTILKENQIESDEQAIVGLLKMLDAIDERVK